MHPFSTSAYPLLPRLPSLVSRAQSPASRCITGSQTQNVMHYPRTPIGVVRRHLHPPVITTRCRANISPSSPLILRHNVLASKDLTPLADKPGPKNLSAVGETFLSAIASSCPARALLQSPIYASFFNSLKSASVRSATRHAFDAYLPRAGNVMHYPSAPNSGAEVPAALALVQCTFFEVWRDERASMNSRALLLATEKTNLAFYQLFNYLSIHTCHFSPI
jgi:hypothetical protein